MAAGESRGAPNASAQPVRRERLTGNVAVTFKGANAKRAFLGSSNVEPLMADAFSVRPALQQRATLGCI